MKNPKSFTSWLQMARNCSLDSFKRLRKEQQDILYLDYDKYRIKAIRIKAIRIKAVQNG